MIVTVAALRTELLFVPRPRVQVGVGAEAAGRLRRWLNGKGPRAALVVGFSGAARAGLAAGTVVLAASIVSDGADPVSLDGVLVARAQEALPKAVVGPVATVDRPAGPAEKARLGVDALAVDMESSPLARELSDRGIPFLVVRVVLDELWEDVFSGPRARWAGQAIACARRLGAAAAALRPVWEGT
ncbi:TPA: hypothetical protein DCY65_00420 [Candidatus Acetothermia bacterium]|nr:hypothetical protein [Candidatus Acetothermia bacterium]